MVAVTLGVREQVALDRDAFEAAWTQGAAMTPEETVAYALT